MSSGASQPVPARQEGSADARPGGGDPQEAAALGVIWRAVYSPDGSTARCRKCDSRRPFHRVSARRAFACDRCGSHLYPASETPFAGSPLPLAAWLEATAAVVGSTRRVSPRQLADALHLSYRTAWRMCRKIQDSLAAGGKPGCLLQDLAASWARQVTPAARPAAALDRPADRIRAAACQVMAKRGASAARISDIAAAAAVSVGSVHYYFRSKDEALLDALRWAGEQLHESLQRLRDADVTPIEHLRRLLELSFPSNEGLHNEYLLWLEVWVRVRDHPAFLEECLIMSGRWHEAVRQVFGRGAAAGLFTPVTDLEEVCERYVAMAESLAYRAVLGYRTPERAREILTRFTAEQLGLPAGEL
jgi:AcrR family transcriptional regulator/transposase-like protein